MRLPRRAAIAVSSSPRRSTPSKSSVSASMRAADDETRHPSGRHVQVHAIDRARRSRAGGETDAQRPDAQEGVFVRRDRGVHCVGVSGCRGSIDNVASRKRN
jgi:hypothetical protein